MRRTGFRFYPTSVDCPQDIRMAFVDEKGIVSPTVVSFRTMMNVVYNLDPHPRKPWFKILDADDTDSIHGCWMNHPQISSKEIIPTSPIIEVTTADGDTISTWKYSESARIPAQLAPEKKSRLGVGGAVLSWVFH